jgi:hypothetical protein
MGVKVFNSTLIVNGEAWGSEYSHSPQSSVLTSLILIVVVRTGDHTFIGELLK